MAHICNDQGSWGKGFVLGLSKRWKQPETEYKKLPAPLSLGSVQFVKVENDLEVANMVAQGPPTEETPISCSGLQKVLKVVADRALATKAVVHMPRIGVGLARGKWNIVSHIIWSELCLRGVEVCVYSRKEAPKAEKD